MPSKVHLWKFPRNIIPSLKESYLKEDWLYLINQYNYYMVGEKLCPVCPASVDKIKEVLQPIFLADIEVLYKEQKEADKKALIELFVKYVSPTADPLTIAKIPVQMLKSTIATFANEDLKARQIPELRRKRIFRTVFRVKYDNFAKKYCDSCTKLQE